MNLLKTKAQIKRERDYARIMAMYAKLREDNPDASNHAIHLAIAKKMGWTRAGVYNVVRRFKNEDEHGTNKSKVVRVL